MVLKRCVTSVPGEDDQFALLVRHPDGYAVARGGNRKGFISGTSCKTYSAAHSEYSATLYNAAHSAWYARQTYLARTLPSDEWTDEVDRRLEVMATERRYVPEASSRDRC